MKHWLALLLMTICTVCGARPETLVEGGYDEAEMEAAIARARKEVDSFIAVLKSGNGSDFAVKAPVKDGADVEHFWLTDISYKNGEFTGKIGNEPGIVSNVRFGQTYKIRKEDISDWLYMRGGKMYGNYTMRPLLATMPEAEAAQYRSILAEP